MDPQRRYSDEISDVSDGETKVLPIPGARILLDRPVLIAGFPDNGMIGSICTNHIIEQLRMHQIASIESQYIMPGAIFIGKRFRYPFRIYSNESGSLCVLICEVPVLAKGVTSLVNTAVEWSIKAGVQEIVTLGGILPSNFSPPYLLERKPLILQNDGTQLIKNLEEKPGVEMVVPDDAVIIGITGATLSRSAARGLKCTALMIPTIADGPDPEGAAILLESLAATSLKLKIDTSALRQKVEEIKQHLQEFLRMHKQQMQQYEQAASREAERIYK